MAERYSFYSLRAHPCRLSLCLRRDSIVMKRDSIYLYTAIRLTIVNIEFSANNFFFKEIILSHN